VFDFGAANVVFQVPYTLAMHKLQTVAAALSEPERLVKHARSVAEPVFHRLTPAFSRPDWNRLYEEYFIFQIHPGESLPAADQLLRDAPHWLASLLRLETGTLHALETAEALRYRVSYYPQDVVIIEWAAAVVVDRDCDETLQTMAFANLQLLEFRCIDQKVGDALAAAQRQIRPAVQSWLPFWRTHGRPLRALTEIRLDAVGTFERASSVLQLVGDQYLSRVYRLLSQRFRLDEWGQNVQRSLDVAQSVHATLSSQSSMYRLELLELAIVLLILFEIVMAFIRHR
jgi:hypothetical protein